MKKQILFITLIAALVVTAVLFISSDNLEKTDQVRPKVMSMTSSVEIPDKMIFAGETYTFERYDMRERLDRELNSFTYFHSTTLLL
ncbi:MAG: lytic transglycosylase domain-containing protein, partial [Dysgonamonadaceae bacterium]|nr:lytic transglycosylase domain-containing protein [Dysgonamonadaceae bacterium]